MTRVMDESLQWRGPLYVRIAKGGDPIVSQPEVPFEIGRAIVMRPGADILFIGTGVMTTAALRAGEVLAEQGIDAGVLHVHTIKPLDRAAVLAAAARVSLVVSVEEHSLIGGLGSALAELFADESVAVPLLRLGLGDRFPREYGSQAHALAVAGLTPSAIAAAATQRLRASGRIPVPR
jgi:transketolase